jgi:xanthine dehydrogenase accessory factor
VLIEPDPDPAALRQTVALLNRREEAELALPLGPGHAFRLRRYVPAARLVVAGAGPEAERLVALAGAFGAEALQLFPGRDLALGLQPAAVALDAWTAVALLFHDHEWEGPLLEWALASAAFYIGALGGQVTRESRQTWLEAQGHAAAAIARIASPMGAIPHARDAGVLALSVLAEVIARYEQQRLRAWQS